MLLVFASPLWAANCTAVFSDPDGTNSNLQAAGNTLDLSGVPFANNPWPASGGTPLSSGDYYYSADNLGNNYRLNVASDATVRIFVNGSLSAGNGLELNPGGDTGQLLLVVNGSLSVGNNAEINGLVYAAGSIGVGNNGELEGGLAAGGSVGAGNNTNVNADYSGVASGLLEGLCEPPVELSANGQSVGPVTVNLGEAVTFSVAASGCPTAEATWFSDGWVDTWREGGADFAQGGFDQSPCERLPEQTRTYTEPGSYTVAFESEYCSDGRFFFCGGYTVFGQDEITVEVVDPDDNLTCFGDEFTNSDLNPDDWVTSVSSGNYTPAVVGGRMRMTEAQSNQSTAATLQREIPGAENLVVLEFDYYAYGGSGADGLAIVLSDSAITPQPGSFGGSLGYAQRNNGDPGFAGGWLGIGLDEYGNFSNANEGRVGGNGFQPDAVAIRGAYQGNYRYLRGTGSLTPGVDQSGNNPTAHRYRITVDSRAAGEAMVSVERDITGTGNNFQTLIPSFNALNESGQPDVPENFLLSLTGSTGGSTNIHELDEIELCALKLNPVGAQVDHFEIIHDGVALTCQPETVTIRACADAACDSPAGLFTDPVIATLAPESGWVSGNPVTFTGGVGQATLQNTTGGVVSLDVVGSQPSTRPQSVTLCDNGSGTLSSANCNLAFFESGLAFDVPNLLSHRPSGPVEIRAVRQDPQTQACVPAFENVQKTVRFWSGYVDPGPNGRPVSRPLTVNGTEVSGDSAAPTDLMLGFGPGGIAEVDVTYPDAGQVTLDARYVGSPATNDDGLVMPGADSFISVPVGLCVSAAGECPAGDDSCPVFVRADEVFELSLTAVGWESAGDTDLCQGNPVTPNFRLLDIPLTSAVMAPAGGREGSFTPVSYTHARSADATTRVDARVSEVGVFEFTAAPNAGSYLGLSVDGGTSPPVGRFYPDRFRVSVDPGELDAACAAASPYTYTGQDFDWFTTPALQIEPLSVLGAPTENYTEPGFQRLTPTGVARSFPTQDRIATDASGAPMVLERTFSDGAVSVLAPGLLQYQYAPGDTFRYTKTPDTRVTPFSPELEFQVNSVTDSDGVNASAAPYEFTPEADFPIRYGRLAMENVYGPETLAALQMPFRLEYWDGGQYVLNTDDSCTPWTTTTIAGTADHHTLVPDAGTFTAGEAQPLVLKPDGSRGTDTLVWNLADWLREDMNGDGGLDDPSATATFGVYRGHDRVIYWQEKP
ncbi:MAG TPA: DUF6701 domain-containing protein [Marinobacter sp.]|uniref:DUF6701 domain-containing protein n=1 Tax=Marinobacter sp. TaxID=50741 RepID=UPI002D7F4917|nr:DUF6701 domain-containing protein [Marinobacter sp.]HET8800804.1 DUF6701 domain-containing protein [Marinobacter sp.]